MLLVRQDAIGSKRRMQIALESRSFVVIPEGEK
jgi:hypothetical protein